MNLLLFSKEQAAEGIVTVTGERAKHLLDVSKVTVGMELRVGEWNGRVGIGKVIRADAGIVQLTVDLMAECAEQKMIDLIVALPRPQMVKDVVQIAAMVGIRRLFLIRAAGVEKSYFQSRVIKPESIHHLLRLGLEQAVSTKPPEVIIYPRFLDIFRQNFSERCFSNEMRIVADPGGAMDLASIWRTSGESFRGSLAVAVGPEQGWKKHELEVFAEHGFLMFNMGPRILRVEVAVSLLVGKLGLLQELAPS